MKFKTPTSAIAKFALLALLLLFVVFLQYAYDAEAQQLPTVPSGTSGVTPLMVRLADMGFDPATASFSWITTMPEILDLFNGKQEYFGDLAFVNAIDPKMSYPYAFSVLTLPAVPTSSLPNAVQDAIAIGQQGLQSADPDWRIPYYMAMNYYLWLHDEKDALIYFNIAAQTPGVPQFAARFSLNFGIGTSERQTTEELWRTIASSTNDTFEQQRADAYVEHLTDLDYLDAASKAYKKQFGAYPTSTAALVAKGIIPAVPQDPFGFTFIIAKDGTADVDLTNLPSYIQALPAQ
jgi:hypothetical protein